MNPYSKYILPRMIDWGMSDKIFAPYREKVLKDAYGIVAEIGFGSGANLPHYSDKVERVIGIDPSQELKDLAKKRLRVFKPDFAFLPGPAEKIDLPNHSVDCAVSTFTLCSVENPMRVLSELKRIVKRGGKLFFMEHGLAPDLKVQKWQNRLNPLQRRMCGGCNLNRNILGILADACFDVSDIERFYVKKIPRPFGFLSLGSAQ